MQKAQKNIQSGLDQLDDVMGKRTKAIQRKLRNVEISVDDSLNIALPESSVNDDFDDEEG